MRCFSKIIALSDIITSKIGKRCKRENSQSREAV